MTTLLLLAGGLATRFGADKQLEQVGPAGELLLEYALYDGWRAGCERALLIVRPGTEAAFAASLLSGWRSRIDLQIVPQRLEDLPRPVPWRRRKPWGTAHAVLATREHVRGDLLVANADDFYGRRSYQAMRRLLAETDASGVGAHALGRTLSAHGGVSRAICRTDAAGRLLHIEERTGIVRRGDSIVDDRGDVLAADTPVSMNLWALRASFLPVLEGAMAGFLDRYDGSESAELRIPDVVNEQVRAGLDVRVVPLDEEWFGMTYSADRAAVSAALAARVAAGEYPDNLRAV